MKSHPLSIAELLVRLGYRISGVPPISVSYFPIRHLEMRQMEESTTKKEKQPYTSSNL